MPRKFRILTAVILMPFLITSVSGERSSFVGLELNTGGSGNGHRLSLRLHPRRQANLTLWNADITSRPLARAPGTPRACHSRESRLRPGRFDHGRGFPGSTAAHRPRSALRTCARSAAPAPLGEFGSILGIIVWPDGSPAVNDHLRTCLQLFGADGRFQRVVRWRPMVGRLLPHLGASWDMRPGPSTDPSSASA